MDKRINIANPVRLLFLSSFVFLIACLPAPPENDTNYCLEGNKANTHLMIFMDKTLSVQPDETQIKTFQTKLNELIKEEMSIKGDRTYGLFIHGNTLGVSPFFDDTFKESCPQGLSKLGGFDREAKISEYTGARSLFRRNCNDALNRSLQTINPDNTKNETDLWGCLEAMSKFFAAAQTGEEEKIAIFISDMVESSRGSNRRDFHRKPPASKAEAENMAVADAQWIIENLAVSKKNLEGTTIRIWAPVSTTEANSFQFLKYYWERLFEEFGIDQVVYN